MSNEELKTAFDEQSNPCLKCSFFDRDLNDCLFYGSSWIEIPDYCPKYDILADNFKGVTSDEQ